jgi:hypothetical protein
MEYLKDKNLLRKDIEHSDIPSFDYVTDFQVMLEQSLGPDHWVSQREQSVLPNPGLTGRAVEATLALNRSLQADLAESEEVIKNLKKTHQESLDKLKESHSILEKNRERDLLRLSQQLQKATGIIVQHSWAENLVRKDGLKFLDQIAESIQLTEPELERPVLKFLFGASLSSLVST